MSSSSLQPFHLTKYSTLPFTFLLFKMDLTSHSSSSELSDDDPSPSRTARRQPQRCVLKAARESGCWTPETLPRGYKRDTGVQPWKRGRLLLPLVTSRCHTRWAPRHDPAESLRAVEFGDAAAMSVGERLRGSGSTAGCSGWGSLGGHVGLPTRAVRAARTTRAVES